MRISQSERNTMRSCVWCFLVVTGFLVLIPVGIMAQSVRYDLLLKGGHVIDPANQLDQVLDVAVSRGKIAAVEANIPANEAGKVVDVTGLYVTPGLIDI